MTASPPPDSGIPALELTGVVKRFGAFVALNDVSLRLRRGTVHALLGENGAGKTTLMRIAFGMLPPDGGSITVRGQPLRARSPADAIAAGVGMVHQHFALVPAMTVAENIALGGRGLLSESRIEQTVRDISARTGFALDPRALVETLGVGAQQRAEIAKALARDATVLVLDEPTAVLAPREADDLLRWLRAYVSAGNAAVLITHKLREALAAADDVTVLRRGRVAFQGTAAGITAEALTRAMIGDDIRGNGSAPHTSHESAPRQPIFRASGLTAGGDVGADRVTDATFTIYAGEIVAVAGVEGSGQRALLRALAGRLPATAGALERPTHVGFVPEDRHADAVLLDRSLTENVALRDAGTRKGLMHWPVRRAAAEALLTEYDVRTAGVGSPMRLLSGGNQQKLVLARELASPCDAIVAENPTRGLDVRAAAQVHARLREARDRGAAIVLYSSDLDEVLQLADRTLVVHAGHVREMPLDRDAIGRAMLGVP